MTYPTLHIVNGPGQRDLEQAFASRHLGASAQFTLALVGDEGPYLVKVFMRVINFQFVTCQGPNYKIGGHLTNLSEADRNKLPRHNFIFVEYNAKEKTGEMEFSNAG